MPLQFAFRRYWAFVVFALLALFTAGFVLPDLPAPLRTTLAPQEQWWVNASKRLDPFINDSFPFRGAVLAAHRTYGRWTGGSQNTQVLHGEDGAMFLREENAVEQSAGQLVRPDMVRSLGAMAEGLDRMVRAQGGTFVMTVPPNGATTNAALLPAYVRAVMRRPTEYDLLAADLAKRDIPFVDLRPVLAAAAKAGPVQWRYDSHWNERGALIGFNAALAAAGRPDLAIDPAQAFGAPVPRHGGDLVRLSGEAEPKGPDLSFPATDLLKAPPGLKPIDGIMKPVAPNDPFVPYAFTTGHDGPRIMVIGDSFTQGLWTAPLAHVASAFAWMHHRSCRFDLGAIARFRPDILIYAPTERNIRCKGTPAREP